MILTKHDFLDNDFYNFNMSQFIWRHFPHTLVRYRFKNRSDNKIKNWLAKSGVDFALSKVAAMQPDLADLRILDEYGYQKDFLSDLYDFKCPDIIVDEGEDEFEIQFEGPWWQAVFLETPVLAEINEAYVGYRGNVGQNRLKDKIDQLKTHPYLNVIEFGTRRRAGRVWQRNVLETLVQQRPYQVKGTSNVRLANELGIQGIGTMAHQMFMVVAALYDHSAVTAQNFILDEWQEMFGNTFLTALPDTFGTEFFIRSLNKPHLFSSTWNVRQDSGDPIEFAYKFLNFWRHHHVDPRSKVITFSDGLTVQKMADIWGQIGNLTNVSFGWGTNLTNDIGLKPLSIVVKPDAVSVDNGLTWTPCCKLSDNLKKAIGDPQALKLYKERCGYTETFSEETIY